jgi:hypothetical protein
VAPAWAKDVRWEKADLLSPGSYEGHLEGADAVVHSMGILLEADYKGVLQGKESIWGGLQRAFSSVKRGSQNPLERTLGEELKSQEKDGQLTYELMNRDSGMYILCISISEVGNVLTLPSDRPRAGERSKEG